ncbi:MAG: DUF167 domain-containing protein [Phycisphaerae bacterium]
MKGAENVSIRRDPSGAIIAVKVVAGASRDGVSGIIGDRLKVATSTAPEKGKANAAVAETLADFFGLAKRQVRLVSGTTRPQKAFLLEGLNPAVGREKLRQA